MSLFYSPRFSLFVIPLIKMTGHYFFLLLRAKYCKPDPDATTNKKIAPSMLPLRLKHMRVIPNDCRFAEKIWHAHYFYEPNKKTS